MLRLPLPTRTVESIDYTGAGLTVAAVTPLILVTVWGGRTFPWGSAIIIGLVALSVVMVGALVWWERRAREPIFPPRVFTSPIVRAVDGDDLLRERPPMFAAIIYIPVYLQLVDGVSATRSGVLLLPLMGGMLTTSIISGRLVTRFGRYKVYPVCGTALMSVGMYLFTRLGVHTSLTVAGLYMVVFGIGMGMTLQIVVVAVQNAVERRDLGSATSAVSFFRNIGAACGTALLGTVLVSRLGFWLPRLVPAHSGLNLSQAFTITPRALRALPPPVARRCRRLVRALPARGVHRGDPPGRLGPRVRGAAQGDPPHRHRGQRAGRQCGRRGARAGPRGEPGVGGRTAVTGR